MPFIGNAPSNNFVSLKRQDITGDGTASYTLDYKVASVNDVLIYVNHVKQDPSSYTISGTSLTMGGNVSSSDDFYIIYLGQGLQTVTPADNTITTAMLQDDAVTSAKIDGSLGKVLQVVEGSTTDSTTLSTTTFVDVGLSASITPSSSSNKILVLVNCMNMKNNTSTGGSSSIRIMVDTGSGYSEVREYPDILAYNDNDVNNPSPQILHSPNTTSSTTYKVQAAQRSGYSSGSARFNNRSADVAGAVRSSIILMEISA